MAGSKLGNIEATLTRLFNRRLRSVIAPTDLTPVQITVVYTFLAFWALYFSDVYLPQTIQNQALLTQIQALKGGVEVVLTAGLILLLTTQSRRAIETRNERLDFLRAERNVLYRVFRHNLRQDLNVIMGYSELVRRETRDQDLREKCDKVMKGVANIQNYQDKIVEIERVLDPDIELQRLDLVELATSNSFLQYLQDVDWMTISLDFPDTAPVVTTPLVQQAITEVLENAVEHSPERSPEIRLSIEEQSTGLLDLVIEDDGPGISDYERSALDSMLEEDLVHSSGLGLWLAKLTCGVSGGQLELSKADETGGLVKLRLPVAYDRNIRRILTTMVGYGSERHPPSDQRGPQP